MVGDGRWGVESTRFCLVSVGFVALMASLAWSRSGRDCYFGGRESQIGGLWDGGLVWFGFLTDRETVYSY